MKTLKITIQDTSKPFDFEKREFSTLIDCDEYELINRTITIDNEDVVSLFKEMGDKVKIGDRYTSPTSRVKIIKDGKVEYFNVLGDPYYKIEELVNDKWVMVDGYKFGES